MTSGIGLGVSCVERKTLALLFCGGVNEIVVAHPRNKELSVILIF